MPQFKYLNVKTGKALSTTLIIAIVALIVVVAVAGVLATRKGGETATPTQTTPTPSPTTTPSPTQTQTITTPITTQTTPTTAKTLLKVAIGIDLDTVDPHGQTTTVVFNVMRHVYETLVALNEKGEVVPCLAEKWEVSSDGLVYTLYLRKGVKFHDGSMLDAETVKKNFDRWFDPTVKVPLRAQLGPVDHVEVVDQYTVKVYLKEPFAPFLRSLASYLLIASKEAINKFGNSTIEQPAGTGPFRFVAWEKGKRVVLERFDEYWGEKPLIQRIEWYIIPEASTRATALLAGDVDFAYNLPATDLNRLKASPGITVLTPTSNRVIFIALLPKGPLADPLVRQALNYAVDKNAIIQNILFGLAVEADSPLPSHFFGYVPMPKYDYNPQRAKELLAQAGYPNGFKMVLLHPTGRYLMDKQVAEAVQAYLSQVGVQVELKTMDWPSFVSELQKPLDQKTFDAVLLGWGPFVADAYFTLNGQFLSTNAPPKGLAAAHYNNSVVDNLLLQAARETDDNKRKELYKQAIEIIWKDAPWIFLYTQKNFYASTSKLAGYQIHVDGEQVYFFKAYFTG
jgi:peptide/nickel transport system substrate-binding protein